MQSKSGEEKKMDIENFKAMSGCNDNLTAVRFLTESDYDLGMAVNNYYENSLHDDHMLDS